MSAESKALAKIEKLSSKLREKNGALREITGGHSSIPQPVSSAISVASAAACGYVDGQMADGENKHAAALVVIGAGVAGAIGGAVTKSPNMSRVALDVATGPACGLAFLRAQKAGTESRLARAAKAHAA